MFGQRCDGKSLALGPAYEKEIAMGQATSGVERESSSSEPGHHQPSITTIVREDSIQQIDEEPSSPCCTQSRPDSCWSIHCDRTDQAPYALGKHAGEMMTSTSLLGLPRKNPSADLAFFLQTTGPVAPHRRPSKAEHRPRSGVATPTKKALHFLKLRPRRAKKTFVTPYDRPDILESSISISIEDDNWFSTIGSNYSRQIDGPYSPAPPRYSPVSMCKTSAHLPLGKDTTVRVVDHSSPIRPRASNPPTPQPESAISMAMSYRSDLPDHPAKRSFDACRALSSHPVNVEPGLTALPKMPLPKPAVNLPSPGREVEIKHPSPRRFASHPVLLQRASSIASSLYPRSFSDSPGPPPPRSPLRLGRDPRTIEGIIATHTSVHSRKFEAKVAPSIETVAEYSTEYNEILAAMQPTVTTDCTGPIKRPRSRGKSSITHPAYPSSRKEREERIRTRKLRDRSNGSRTIDTVVNATPPQSLTRRLRKARPQIQIPELKPAPLVTRASSSASSIASWKKITECTRTPVSPVPSQDSPGSNGEKTGYTPVSPTASNGSTSAEARMALSPVMLVAEEIPVPKTKSTPKPAKLVLRDGKSFAPRPRSASIPHAALKRRSRTGSHTPAMQQTPPRSVSPMQHASKEDSPPLPSPPPNRALPPTPPASGSERPAKIRATEAKKHLPIPPVYEILPKASTPPKRSDPLPHVVTQAQRKSISPKDFSSGSKPTTTASSKLDSAARLEALEKQNAMLSAALVAVLRTNGAINGPLSALAAATEPESPVRAMALESRVARRSAASQGAGSHAASSSNGSALEMYMSTRRGSRQGCGGA
ncbi:hypothetical protein LTR91_026398 [Friedmanniomyces endolithicus]|uniref:Uncharacterized protein n=1 Tax=Friedmanniomyces endolithicus TaxID=329885 RepID=A0AAN6GWZ1_9PEZI|nr:hypothetical protein LTR57_025324 [Friedmanniomyces endolithicus]KAK0949513.1 hypothetical protein LTR91_026398 [Friedmanniomyces endolithicus]KAK0954970.1 hypothetical protein LTS01_023631 [Friedmanniomyces endolithicus]